VGRAGTASSSFSPQTTERSYPRGCGDDSHLLRPVADTLGWLISDLRRGPTVRQLLWRTSVEADRIDVSAGLLDMDAGDADAPARHWVTARECEAVAPGQWASLQNAIQRLFAELPAAARNDAY